MQSLRPVWPSWFVIKITAFTSLGGVLFGYDSGCIAGALPQIEESLGLSSGRSEMVVSTLYVGAGIGALVGGSVCDLFGRRKLILWSDVVFTLGAACLFLSNTFTDLILGRFIVGTAVAVSGVANVSYLHEISPIEIRGAIVSVNEAMISFGFLLAYAAGFEYRSSDDEEWRMIFGWAGVLASIQFFGMLHMPESPAWLNRMGRKEESLAAQIMIDGTVTADSHATGQFSTLSFVGSLADNERVTSAMEYHLANDDSTQHGGSQPQSIVEILKAYRRQTTICLFLSTTQQFCGQASVLNYAPYIFTLNYGEKGSAHLQTLSLGLMKFVVTVIVILRIEKFGRRALLLSGMFLISMGQFALAMAFIGLDVESDTSITVMTSNFALPGALLVVCGYSMSFGPLGWLLTSELFPTEIRARALGMSTIVTYLCASIVTNSFLSALSTFGATTTFGTYFLVNTTGMLFAYLAIPNTDKKTVKQIEDSLQEMWWWRGANSVDCAQFQNDCGRMPTEKTNPEMKQHVASCSHAVSSPVDAKRADRFLELVSL